MGQRGVFATELLDYAFDREDLVVFRRFDGKVFSNQVDRRSYGRYRLSNSWNLDLKSLAVVTLPYPYRKICDDNDDVYLFTVL